MNESTTRTGLVGITTVGLLLLAISLLAIMSSCTKDSTDKVDDANKQRIENQSAAISPDAKDEAVKMAERMVDLAGMNMTARSLSEEALKMATNPQVKTFARQMMDANRRTDNELTQLARSLNLQLPTALSKEGKNRLADLKNLEPSTVYDLKYLNDLGEVSNKSADIAEDLEDDATTEAVKAYGKKARQMLEAQKKATKQLTEVLK